ncbi:MAG: helix-turn-helix domain-containing protein [bacterium]
MKNPLLIKLGTRIRLLRKARGLSQEGLSWKAELHPTYLAQIERGEVNPSFNVLYKIANALQISLSDFFSFLIRKQ